MLSICGCVTVDLEYSSHVPSFSTLLFSRFILQSKEVIHNQLLEKQKVAEEKIKELEVCPHDNSSQLVGKRRDNSFVLC